ncbi:MAG: GIY-YIG nuclease family protein [Chloroflexi bacterium]|nr:GIY-YIG nuclease family protein [Chloroflexota bacterium]MCI0779668.1 GIY-YIG nuclease family protein [Chloroflexota bacterium]MCI0793154.1 GIY-YIG nuclease family protein [Chloroflexota bacterium]MCI0799418.1 GIY-YIG nuclease family protein [Chloroflexota bacterium]MCI0823188.1 GIY-YIG nuclease family protein [Chloroflexota bacterium]
MITVYVLRSEASGRYYIGCAQDPKGRLLEHNSGTTISTRGRGPWKMVYVEWHETLALARHRETQLKSWRNPAYLEQRLGIGADNL